MHAKWATWVSDCVTHCPLKCGLRLPGILSSLWQTRLFLATKAPVSGAGGSSAPQMFQQSHSMQAATSQVLVPVTGLLAHPLTTEQHLDWICRRKKKPSRYFVCSPYISSHTPISKKREGNDHRKSPCQHKSGVKSPGLVQYCCHFTPQTLLQVWGHNLLVSPHLSRALQSSIPILGMLQTMLGWALPALGLDISLAQRQLATPSTAGFGLSLRGQK